MGLMEDFVCKVGITEIKRDDVVLYAPNTHKFSLNNNNSTTVWLQRKLFLLLLSEMPLVDFDFFFILPALLWWGSSNRGVTRVYMAAICVRFLFSKGSSSLFREGTKVQNICHQILESHLKEERLSLRKEKQLLSGHHSCSSEKAPMSQYFSRQNTVPDGGGNTDKQKRRYLGLTGSTGKGRPAPGSEPFSSLLRAGESLRPRKKWLPLGEIPRRNPLRDPAVPSPRPSQFLRTPQRGRTAVPLRLLPAAHAQLFVCCWSFSFLRKNEEKGWRMGWRKGEELGKKRCTFAAVDGGRKGLLFC